jgi:DpnII restriction endonuclease
MDRHRQTFEEIISRLSVIQADWQDELAQSVIGILRSLDGSVPYSDRDLQALLKRDFDAGLTLIRLVLDLSKDEFVGSLREILPAGIGANAFRTHPEAFVQGLVSLGVLDKMREAVETPVTWRDVLIERLKTGRGSAIKAQARGKFLEDRTEEIVREVFGAGYDARCRFVGATGLEGEKADFAIPSKLDPRILIEVKAYGATGSKQTDILGDMERIISKKRHDTTLLFVTDGITWKLRPNDLRKLIGIQNRGQIARIYTSQMFPELIQDLIRLRTEHGIAAQA